ncbi:hypothetical protein D3C80_753760 [compost metagenome]
MLQRAIQHAFEHPVVTLPGFKRQIVTEQHKSLGQLAQLLDDARQVGQVITFNFNQTQASLGMLGQQCPHQRRLAGAARPPQQSVVGRHAIEELTRIATQLLALLVDADQIRQAHVQADLQRQQIAAAAITLPACSQTEIPVDLRARGRQQRFKTGEHGFGALQKSIQTRVHKVSSRQIQGQRHC